MEDSDSETEDFYYFGNVEETTPPSETNLQPGGLPLGSNQTANTNTVFNIFKYPDKIRGVMNLYGLTTWTFKEPPTKYIPFQLAMARFLIQLQHDLICKRLEMAFRNNHMRVFNMEDESDPEKVMEEFKSHHPHWGVSSKKTPDLIIYPGVSKPFLLEVTTTKKKDIIDLKQEKYDLLSLDGWGAIIQVLTGHSSRMETYQLHGPQRVAQVELALRLVLPTALPEIQAVIKSCKERMEDEKIFLATMSLAEGFRGRTVAWAWRTQIKSVLSLLPMEQLPQIAEVWLSEDDARKKTPEEVYENARTVQHMLEALVGRDLDTPLEVLRSIDLLENAWDSGEMILENLLEFDPRNPPDGPLLIVDALNELSLKDGSMQEVPPMDKRKRTIYERLLDPFLVYDVIEPFAGEAFDKARTARNYLKLLGSHSSTEAGVVSEVTSLITAAEKHPRLTRVGPVLTETMKIGRKASQTAHVGDFIYGSKPPRYHYSYHENMLPEIVEFYLDTDEEDLFSLHQQIPFESLFMQVTRECASCRLAETYAKTTLTLLEGKLALHTLLQAQMASQLLRFADSEFPDKVSVMSIDCLIPLLETNPKALQGEVILVPVEPPWLGLTPLKASEGHREVCLTKDGAGRQIIYRNVTAGVMIARCNPRKFSETRELSFVWVYRRKVPLKYKHLDGRLNLSGTILKTIPHQDGSETVFVGLSRFPYQLAAITAAVHRFGLVASTLQQTHQELINDGTPLEDGLISQGTIIGMVEDFFETLHIRGEFETVIGLAPKPEDIVNPDEEEAEAQAVKLLKEAENRIQRVGMLLSQAATVPGAHLKLEPDPIVQTKPLPKSRQGNTDVQPLTTRPNNKWILSPRIKEWCYKLLVILNFKASVASRENEMINLLQSVLGPIFFTNKPYRVGKTLIELCGEMTFQGPVRQSLLDTLEALQDRGIAKMVHFDHTDTSRPIAKKLRLMGKDPEIKREVLDDPFGLLGGMWSRFGIDPKDLEDAFETICEAYKQLREDDKKPRPDVIEGLNVEKELPLPSLFPTKEEDETHFMTRPVKRIIRQSTPFQLERWNYTDQRVEIIPTDYFIVNKIPLTESVDEEQEEIDHIDYLPMPT